MRIVQAALAQKTRIIDKPGKPDDAHVERKRFFTHNCVLMAYFRLLDMLNMLICHPK